MTVTEQAHQLVNSLLAEDQPRWPDLSDFRTVATGLAAMNFSTDAGYAQFCSALERKFGAGLADLVDRHGGNPNVAFICDALHYHQRLNPAVATLMDNFEEIKRLAAAHQAS